MPASARCNVAVKRTQIEVGKLRTRRAWSTRHREPVAGPDPIYEWGVHQKRMRCVQVATAALQALVAQGPAEILCASALSLAFVVAITRERFSQCFRGSNA